MFRILVVVSAVLLFTACATPGDQASVGARGEDTGKELVATADVKKAEEDVVCRRERKTGSNMAKTVCYTREALEQLEEESQRNLRDYQNRAASPTSNN